MVIKMSPDKKLPDAAATEILKQGKYGVLSTVSADGIPYGVPVNYFYVAQDNALYFHCAVKGRKIENITANSKVSFVVIGSEQIVEDLLTTRYESVMVTGTASLITDEEEKRAKLLQLCEVLTPTAVAHRGAGVVPEHLPPVAIVKIAIDEISGKKH